MTSKAHESSATHKTIAMAVTPAEKKKKKKKK